MQSLLGFSRWTGGRKEASPVPAVGYWGTRTVAATSHTAPSRAVNAGSNFGQANRGPSNREGLWLPVRTWKQPDPRNLDSRALIEIALPPGGAVGGPQLDRAGWIADGTHSDPAFDLRLSLAWLWDSVKASNSGHRVYATRPRVERTVDGVILDRNDRPVIRRNGRPVKDWSDPVAPARSTPRTGARYSNATRR